MKILLFDLNPMDQDEVGDLLLELGHEVFVESHHEAAAARIDEADIRVVIGDGRLPKFGWRDLVRDIRSDPDHPYVYFLLVADSKADESHEEWATEVGVDDFIGKLGDRRELRRRLRMASRIVEAVLRLW
jgi:DNA-binding response OmpR family regulator